LPGVAVTNESDRHRTPTPQALDMSKVTRSTAPMRRKVSGRPGLLLSLSMALAAPASVAQSVGPPGYPPAAYPPAAPVIHAFFACAQGRTLRAVFDNRPPPSVWLTLSDGRQMRLALALSGSGARYANHRQTRVFWNHGRTAFLQEHGTITYAACRQRR
jgi:membrane-bound inhibitor of C-type lysozyme